MSPPAGGNVLLRLSVLRSQLDDLQLDQLLPVAPV